MNVSEPLEAASGTSQDDPVARRAAHYSAHAREYARLWSPVIRPMGQCLFPALPLAEAARILDIGIGTGALVSDIHAFAPNAGLIGVDRAEGMLRVAQDACDDPLAVMDAQRLALRAACVDV